MGGYASKGCLEMWALLFRKFKVLIIECPWSACPSSELLWHNEHCYARFLSSIWQKLWYVSKLVLIIQWLLKMNTIFLNSMWGRFPHVQVYAPIHRIFSNIFGHKSSDELFQKKHIKVVELNNSILFVVKCLNILFAN